jgi:PAS domain S-box-containing protein
MKKETVQVHNGLETLHDGYFEMDMDGRLESCNPGLFRLMGYSGEEMNGSSFKDFMDEKNILLVDAFLSRKNLFQNSCEFIECEVRHRDGTVMTLETILSPIRNKAGKQVGVRGLARDMTEHRRLQQHHLYTTKMKSVGRLAGGIAHDFNNLLFVIMGNAELMQSIVPGECKKNVDKILSSCLVGSDIIKKLLQFSFPTDQNKQVIDLNRFVRAEVKRLQGRLTENISLEAGFAEQPLFVYVNAFHVGMMLTALVDNAVEAMKKTGGAVVLKLEHVRLRERPIIHYPGMRPGDYARIVVQDNGPGIPTPDLHKIFDPYFSTKQFVPGAGMGLSIVHGIINECRGTITVESHEGEGTTFRVLVPLADYP